MLYLSEAFLGHVKEFLPRLARIEISPDEDVAMVDLVYTETHSVHLVYMPPGKKIRAHLHRERDEFYVILQGKARIRLGQDEYSVGENYVVYVPRGTVHSVESIGHEPLILIFISSPKYDPKRDRKYVE